MKTLSYFNVKYNPRVPLILLTLRKSNVKIFIFFFFLSSFLSSFPSHITQKVYSVYKLSAHQTTALLSKFLLFLVRAECKLKSASYGFKHTSQTCFCMPFCACLHAQLENEASYKDTQHLKKTTALLLEIHVSILWIRAVCKIRSVSYGSKCVSQPLSDMTFCAYLNSKLINYRSYMDILHIE